MFAQRIIDFVKGLSLEGVINMHPNDLLQCAAACDEQSVGAEKWSVIKMRTTILAGLVIAKNI